jgi:glycosyltransferase involved in cell wall biosynthesis
VIDVIGLFWFISSSRKAQVNKWVSTAEFAFKEYIKSNGFPDVIHAHNALNAGVFAKHVKRKYGIPYVLTEHSTELADWKMPENIFTEIRNSYIEASTKISVSLPFKKQLDNQFFHGEDNFLFMPNVLNNAFEKDIIFSKSDKIRLTHIANLIDIKDQTTLIKAFGILASKVDNLELIIIGDGVDKEKLIRLTNELGLSDKICFKGFLNRKSIIDILSTSNLFVLSSKYETFGVVVIEALACGVPCVASICGGPESIINSSNGKLFEVGNYIQLAEKN